MEGYFWTVGIFLVSQTIGAIWWAANVSSDLKHIKRKFDEIEKDLDGAYSSRDGARLEHRVENLELSYRSVRN